MSIVVKDHARWHRTKIVAGILLFVVAVACAGGLEDESGMSPMPSFGGFFIAVVLLTWRTINIIKDGEW